MGFATTDLPPPPPLPRTLAQESERLKRARGYPQAPISDWHKSNDPSFQMCTFLTSSGIPLRDAVHNKGGKALTNSAT